MSGIAGIFNLDGRPVDRELLERMTGAIAHRGPDATGYWVDGAVGFGHQMLCTTPESLHETQPWRDEEAQLCLVMDGRVDNRDELQRALAARGAHLRNDTDAELVLRSYEVWGEDCPKKIIGDFAFVIWDARRQQLFCARDAIGIRPFFYHLYGQTFMFGTEVRQFFEDPMVRRRPNERMVAEYLADAITSFEETLYQNILRLPPAHSLVIRSGVVKKQKYWDIDLSREIHYRSDQEYTEHFLEVFETAVKCRLRSQARVGVELSGGIDSSSIAAIAHLLYRTNQVPQTGFETFSIMFPNTPADESEYIQEVVEDLGVPCNPIYPDFMEQPQWIAVEIARCLDFPNYPNGIMTVPMHDVASKKGVNVLLGGDGGDQWFMGSLLHYADYIRRLQIVPFLRQVYYDRFDTYHSGATSMMSSTGRAFRIGLSLLVTPRIRRAAKFVLKGQGYSPNYHVWLHKRLSDYIILNEQARSAKHHSDVRNFSQSHLYNQLTTGALSHCNELMGRLSESFGIERRYPYFDQRVVEFAFGLPEEQRWRRNEPKILIRNAMAGHLPQKICNRLTKADFSHVFAETFLALGGKELFRSLAIASIGWVNEEQVVKMYNEFEQLYHDQHPDFTQYMWYLWGVFGIELWFNNSFLGKNLLSQHHHLVA